VVVRKTFETVVGSVSNVVMNTCW